MQKWPKKRIPYPTFKSRWTSSVYLLLLFTSLIGNSHDNNVIGMNHAHVNINKMIVLTSLCSCDPPRGRCYIKSPVQHDHSHIRPPLLHNTTTSSLAEQPPRSPTTVSLTPAQTNIHTPKGPPPPSYNHHLVNHCR